MEIHGVAHLAAAVQAVPDNGTTEPQWMGRMETELVGSAGERSKLNAGVRAGFAPEERPGKGKATPTGDTDLPLHGIIHLIRAIFWVQAEAQFYFAALLSHSALQQGYIDLVHLPLRKLAAEMAMGRCGQGQDYQARGGHVQAMNCGLVDGIRELLLEAADY